MNAPMNPPASAPPAPIEAIGHPRGLSTLFFTEMWERFSYYGMRALLVLFMVDAVRGGMGLTDQTATAIYGLYTAAVYLAALPGGWISDRLLGAQRSIWYGGLVIALGHFVLAIPHHDTFYLGLVLVVIGTGLLKPNISVLVGDLYPEGGARRDAGFTIFYMGINLGAALGPLVCSFLGERMNWHYGFGAAGIGMVLGLMQFKLSLPRLGDIGLRPASNRALNRIERVGLFWGVASLAAVVALAFFRILTFDPVALARGTSVWIAAVGVVYFAGVFLFAKLDAKAKSRVAVIAVLFVSSAIFWAGFEQVGSSFTLFAERFTERTIGFLNFTIPAGWFVSLGPIFIITLAPAVGSLWLALARRNLNLSLPVKFALGLLLLGGGLLVMAVAAAFVTNGQKVWPTWLVTTYFLHTVGELCVSPIGLSSVTKLAPRQLAGQMMGTWFLATSLGNLLAGLMAGMVHSQAVGEMPGQYLRIAALPLAVAVILIVLAKPIKKWMSGVV